MDFRSRNTRTPPLAVPPDDTLALGFGLGLFVFRRETMISLPFARVYPILILEAVIGLIALSQLLEALRG